jgi:serine phosphatase RsbU (regulator of sigma subunit)
MLAEPTTQHSPPMQRPYSTVSTDAALPPEDPQDSEIIFADDEEHIPAKTHQRWRILIVDDEPAIHTATKLVLVNYEFEGRKLELLSAYSAQEAKEMLARETEIALMLLDVVMENDHAGLELVDHVRNETSNKHLRIIIRTGQPGLAPEEEVIRRYDIEGYKQKTELTVAKLYSTVTTGLRSYNELMRIEHVVETKTQQLEKRNEELMNTMRGHQRLQSAILPSVDFMGKYFSKFYLAYKPKDIVSGDIYWFAQHGNTSIFANVDCTGHGVSGALVSLHIYNLLNQTVNQKLIVNPAAVLQELNDELLETLDQRPRDPLESPGFEANVLALNHDTHQLQFSSANRALFHYRDGNLTEYAGDKHPVGDPDYVGSPFTLTEIDLRPKDRVYIFTSGLAQQMGGETNKRYTMKRLREMLEYTQYLSLEDQHRTLMEEFDTWKARTNQSEEVCFISLQPL